MKSRLLVLRSLKKPVPRRQLIDVSFHNSSEISWMSKTNGKPWKNNIQMHAKHSTQLSIRNPRSRRHDTGWRPLVRGRRRVLERRGQQTWREELRAWSHDSSGWASLEARVRRAFVEQAPAWLPPWLVNQIVGKGPSQISASRPMINNALSCDKTWQSKINPFVDNMVFCFYQTGNSHRSHFRMPECQPDLFIGW